MQVFSLAKKAQTISKAMCVMLAHPQLFSLWAWAEEAGGGAFTHSEQGSCSPFVNGRASLSSPGSSPTPRQLISEANFSLLSGGTPPDSEWVNAPPPAELFSSTFVGARGPGRFAPAASAGIGTGIVESLFHPPEGAGGFFHGETSALWRQAKRPGPRALANADEKLGVGKLNIELDY